MKGSWTSNLDDFRVEMVNVDIPCIPVKSLCKVCIEGLVPRNQAAKSELSLDMDAR